MKFYPADWRADAMLRLCSIGARGLWAEMMCIMHDAEPYGSLLVNGRRIDKKQLAGLAGVSEKECTALLMELEGNGVFSRDEDGTIYSRRMRRDHEKAIKDKANGQKGGNPAVKGGVNPPDNGEDKAQKPEARSQIPIKEEPSLRSGSAPAKRGTRLPSDWTPDESDTRFATEQGLSFERLRTEALKFRNYWTSKSGKDAIKLDWSRTWQNWILNAKGPANGYRTANPRKTGHDAMYAVLARKAREIVGDGDVAGPASETEFSFGDGSVGGRTQGYRGSVGAASPSHDGRKPVADGVLEGEVIAPGEDVTGLSDGWRRH